MCSTAFWQSWVVLLLAASAAVPLARAQLVRPKDISLTELIEMMKANPDQYQGTPPSGPIRAAGGTPRPLKVFFDYQLSPGTTQAQSTFLKQKLMPAVGKVISTFFSLARPLTGNLRIEPYCTAFTGNRCNEVVYTCGAAKLKQSWLLPTSYNQNPITGPGVTGGPGVDADIIIMVTNVACDPGVLAYARYCSQEQQIPTWRTTSAQVNWCFYPGQTFDANLAIIVHELTHALGFSPSLWTGTFGFIRPDLTQYSPVQLFKRNGADVAHATSPAALAAARSQLGCPTLKGAPMEDAGGSGTTGAHWEEYMFLGELMVGVATGATRWNIPALTALTLSFLKDSGWYNVKTTSAGYNSWGYKAGCTFANQPASVLAASTDTTIRRHFCKSTANLCTHDFTAIGFCDDIIVASGADVLNGLKYVAAFDDTDCLAPLSASLGPDAGIGGPLSRCVLDTSSRYGASCRPMKCSASGQLLVRVGSTYKPCPAGQKISAGAAGGQIGPCPPSYLLCKAKTPAGTAGYNWLGCPTACSRHGDCINGVCKCFLGWTGTACQTPTV